MFRYIRNVLTGTLYSWNETHNVAINEIENRFLSLSDTERNTAINILGGSSLVIKQILGPTRKKMLLKNLKRAEIKSLNAEDHLKLVIITYEMFSRILGLGNQNFGLDILNIDKKIFGDYSIEIIHSNTENPVKSIIFLYCSVFAKESKIIDKDDPVFKYSFTNLVLATTNLLIDKLKI